MRVPNHKKYVDCTAEAVGYLKKADPVLGSHIDRIGLIERKMTSGLFEALAESIISQQISGKAAATVGARVRNALGGLTPEGVARTEIETIRQCGMSMRKAGYLKSAAEAFLDGSLPVDNIPSMEDEEIIRLLDALPGIGRWTAEMLLIFSLGRPDVFAFDDLAIRRGLAQIHALEKVTKPLFEEYRKIYSPYCSTASLYLWHIAGG